jgi:HPr kinase/phosphorylase
VGAEVSRAIRSIPVEALLEDSAYDLALRAVAGASGLGRFITEPRIQKTGLAVTGYTEHVESSRLQVLGQTEISFFAGLTAAERETAARNYVAELPPCIVVTRGLSPPPEILAEAEARGVPVLVTPLASAVFINRANRFLDEVLADSTSVHGVLIDVLGIGILLLGKSGIGKSEAALDLILRGHRLVADDIVDLRKQSAEAIFGSCSDLIRHHMEIRGLGIINIKDLFGVSAVRDAKKVELVIELLEWNEEEEYERLGIDEQTYTILGVRVPYLRVPVRPGRNMTAIIEVACRNHLLKLQGHHSAREFQDRLNRAIERAGTAVPPPGDEVE